MREGRQHTCLATDAASSHFHRALAGAVVLGFLAACSIRDAATELPHVHACGATVMFG